MELKDEIQILLHHDQASGLLDRPITVSTLPNNSLVANRFRIVRHIADGGMGSVYEAEDLRLNDRVALKTVRLDISLDPQALGYFRQEIRLGKQVTHPNVCRVHDLGIDRTEAGAEYLFLTMQFLSGETLATRIKRAPLSEDEALPLIQDMADALTAAHLAEVIHRDFKSANVMLEDGEKRVRAVVTDFGLARPLKEDISLTSAGITGTVDYMAPEQLRGEKLTPAADIYGLGVVMYEMVTGQLPFKGTSNVAVALMHLTELPTPPRTLVPVLSQSLNDAILRCLMKLPSERFLSAAALKLALMQVAPYQRPPRRLRIRGASLTLPSIVLFFVLATLSIYFFRRTHRPKPPTPDLSIAVMPFANFGDTPEYFGFGFTEEVMNSLGQVPHIRLVGPESSFRFRTATISPEEVGRQLSVHFVLIGSVQRFNNNVHVIVRMVDTTTNSQVWSRDMSRDQRNILFLADDIARVVCEELRISVTDAQSSRYPIDAGGLSARDLYWTGRFLFHQRGDDSVQMSLQYFRSAAKEDPRLAEAYCGIADALFVLAERNLLPSEKALKEARQSARRAVELNSRLPAAYVSLGQLTSVYDRDFSAAEKDFRYALLLDPRLATGWQWLSYQLVKQRRFSEAVRDAEIAVTDDPLSTAANINLAVIYFYAGEDDRAMQQSRKLLLIDPKLFVDHLLIAEIFAGKGLSSEAIHELELVPDVHQEHPMTLRVRVEVYSKAGMKQKADLALKKLLEHARRGGVPPSYVAAAFAALGDRDDAFVWLKRACDEWDAFASVANAYPAFDSIRSDPRWVPLMARLGVTPKMVSDLSPQVSEEPGSSQVLPGHHTAGQVADYAGATVGQEQILGP